MLNRLKTFDVSFWLLPWLLLALLATQPLWAKTASGQNSDVVGVSGGVALLEAAPRLDFGGLGSESASGAPYAAKGGQGSDLIAEGDIRLSAQNDLNLIAAEQSTTERDKNKSSGWNAGVAITAGQDGWSFGITAGGNVGKGYGDGDETTYRNTHVDSQGTVTLQSEADTRLIGARVKGEQVEIDAQNLILQSLQDTATFEGKQQNASAQVTVGYGFSASGSYSQSKIDADYKSVTEQTAILAGDGGYQINVRNNTDLTGALITSTQAAEDQQKNSLSTATLTSRDLENYARYEGSSFGIGASGGFNADFGLGENATPQGSNATNENGTLKTGADSLAVSQSIGFGSDSESDSNTTRSGINTRNITITDEHTQQAITGQTAAETIASLYTPTTTDTAEQNSGALQNNFDQDKVQKELDLQREVTQTFDANRQYVQSEFRKKEEELKKAGKAAEEAGDLEKANELYQEADSWQQKSVLFNMLAGGLSAPVDSATGILASTLAPAISYEIGQYFKDKDEEGSAQHILAHMILGGAIAAAGGNDALTGALAAGAAETITPILANYLYGKDPGELTAEQKQTISAIAGLTGAAVGGIAGDGPADAVAGSQAAQNAVDNNYLTRERNRSKGKIPEYMSCVAQKGIAGCEALRQEMDKANRVTNDALNNLCAAHDVKCNDQLKSARAFLDDPAFQDPVIRALFADYIASTQALFDKYQDQYRAPIPTPIEQWERDHPYIAGGIKTVTALVGMAGLAATGCGGVVSCVMLVGGEMYLIDQGDAGVRQIGTGVPQNTYYSEMLNKSIDDPNVAFLVDFTTGSVFTFGTGAYNGTVRTVAAKGGAGTLEMAPSKFDYLFGRVSSNSHNAARSNELALEMKRLGVPDNAAGRQMLSEHFGQVVKTDGNVVRSYSNTYGNFEVRESLFVGPSGQATRFETTFQILDNGTRRYNTSIPYYNKW